MSAIQPIPEFAREASAAEAALPLRVLAWPIDPGNPYTAALYAEMEAGIRVDRYAPRQLVNRYDVWHVHWPESLLNIRNPAMAALKVRSFLAMVDFVRLRGGKLVWTLHNLKAHDALHPRLEAAFWRRFIPRVDGVISLSEIGLAMARDRFSRLRGLPAAVIPHGHYRDAYPPCEINAREALGVAPGARVILFFGEVRAYKNVDSLVRAFHEVKPANAVLLIAGRPKGQALADEIVSAAARDSRVRLTLGFIKREQVAWYFRAADLVVLPYRQILNSGSALLGLSLNRPVLVPDLGSMSELKRDFGSDWVHTFSGNIDSEKLEASLEWAAKPRSPVCLMPTRYRWRSIREETVRFYREVCRTRVMER